MNETVDLDAQCLLLNDIGEIADAIYYNQLESKFGNVTHSGDSLGEGDNFDEIITLQLNTLSFEIRYVVILICTYTGQSFSKVESATVEVLN